jgi:hypothetical protein
MHRSSVKGEKYGNNTAHFPFSVVLMWCDSNAPSIGQRLDRESLDRKSRSTCALTVELPWQWWLWNQPSILVQVAMSFPAHALLDWANTWPIETYSEPLLLHVANIISD